MRSILSLLLCILNSVFSDKINVVKYAILITGQLERLELESKITNLFIPNVQLDGTTIERISFTIFILLAIESDYSLNNLKFRYKEFDNDLDYSNPNAIVEFIENKTFTSVYPNETYHQNSSIVKKFHKIFNVKCILQQKAINNGDITNYTTKIDMFPTYSGQFQFYHLGRKNKVGYMSEEDLFQKNFRQFNRIRQAAIWMQQEEIKNRYFFDVIIRLREDGYILNKWLIDSQFHVGHFTSLESDRWGGLNDRVYVMDRLFVDTILRGFVENFYLGYPMMNKDIAYGNTERVLSFIVYENQFPQHIVNYCKLPVGVIRGYLVDGNNRIPILFNEEAKKRFNPTRC